MMPRMHPSAVLSSGFLLLSTGLSSCTFLPMFSSGGQETPRTLGARMEKHTEVLQKDIGARNASQPKSMEAAAKYIAALLTQKTFKLSSDQRTVIFGLSSAHVAATLAAVMVGYNVIALEDDYKHELVVGNNLKYLWILSREKKIPENVKNKFLDKAKEIGYNTSQLIWGEQK